MRMFFTGLLMALVTLATPALAADAPAQDVQLTRYVYTVSWEGANGLLPEKGQMDVMLQDDRVADQQQVYVVPAGGGDLVAHLILAEGVGFLSQPGKEQEVMQDFVLGTALVGEYLTVKNILDWAKGQDARTNVNVAQLQRDAKGDLKGLTEDGWKIDYDAKWTTPAGVEEKLPTRWTLVRENGRLKMTFQLKEAMGFRPTALPPGYKPINVM